ncbi:Oidioi.mRNA.OKI2018_I69.PAR.g9629.t1.cds [Oikopleura dioica]|uniref:Oidioi.mRNA.OKI2018_I69.PAR.g9629.t1.cds n=1 Tax=Oikopleura dioica TaxID=34765 RepID=A0ABN7RLN6_OIKDI|nr:Oidioi.mRNA.OKI2018_I69.PAR.g9629.t1.cds [Oikopleura dioica]
MSQISKSAPLLARKRDSKGEDQNEEEGTKSSGNKWSILFLLAVSLARVAMGIFNSITGPTLPVLAQHVCKSPTTVSWIFSGRSVGFLIGSGQGSFVIRAYH